MSVLKIHSLLECFKCVGHLRISDEYKQGIKMPHNASTKISFGTEHKGRELL